MGTATAASTEFSFDRKQIEFIQKTFTNSFKFRLMLASRLPMGFLSGMKVTELTDKTCKVQVRYKWLNKNPFRSMFWAVLGMAAEMSSGAFLIMYTHKQKFSVSTLVTQMESTYQKKAVGKITFVCNAGKDIAAAIEYAVSSGEGVEVVCPMTGYDQQGDVVAEFSFTWSFKSRKPQKISA